MTDLRSDNMPTQLIETVEKIQIFSQLEKGWHYGTGDRIDHAQIQRALELLKFCHQLGFKCSDAFPGADGEILLSLYAGDHYASILLDVKDCYTFSHEVSGELCIDLEKLNLDSTKDHLRVIARRIWHMSDSFIPSIMTQGARGSTNWPLKSHLGEEVYRSYTSSVWKPKAA